MIQMKRIRSTLRSSTLPNIFFGGRVVPFPDLLELSGETTSAIIGQVSDATNGYPIHGRYGHDHES